MKKDVNYLKDTVCDACFDEIPKGATCWSDGTSVLCEKCGDEDSDVPLPEMKDIDEV